MPPRFFYGRAVPSPFEPDALRATVEVLAAIDRPSASPGEAQAAEWIAEHLAALGCRVQVDEELAYTGYARSLAGQTAVGAAGALLARSPLPNRRRLGGVIALAAAAGIVEEVSNGPQVFRKLTMRRRATQNVIGETGDPAADRTLIVLAHHDAASTGRIFDQRAQRALAGRFPRAVERTDTSLPLWWPVVAGPALGAAGAVSGHRGLARTGAVLALASLAAFVDIERSPTVPGANDNLTAVATLVAVATALRASPVRGLRVLLVSCGAEESLQGGIRAFARRHFSDLDPATTRVLNIDTVGSPRLVMLEGEGPFVMEDYADPRWRDRVAAVAERCAIPLRRGLRARVSTDSVIPSRAGYPTATLMSLDETKAISNYHLMSDTAANVDYTTVADAARLVDAVARDLAEG